MEGRIRPHAEFPFAKKKKKKPNATTDDNITQVFAKKPPSVFFSSVYVTVVSTLFFFFDESFLSLSLSCTSTAEDIDGGGEERSRGEVMELDIIHSTTRDANHVLGVM